MFRLAGITQGIAGRVRDGTASSDQAKQYGAFVPILAKMAWHTVQTIK
jgi:catalase (peroxidase I)